MAGVLYLREISHSEETQRTHGFWLFVQHPCLSAAHTGESTHAPRDVSLTS